MKDVLGTARRKTNTACVWERYTDRAYHSQVQFLTLVHAMHSFEAFLAEVSAGRLLETRP